MNTAMNTKDSAPSLHAARCAALCLVLLLWTLLPAAPASAQDEDGALAGVSFSAGVFDLAKYDDTVEAGVEYRWRPFKLWFMDLKPTLGVTATAENGYWGYAGLRWDLPLRNTRWVPTVSFAVAAYEQGDGKNLGGTLEFRSGLDVGYRLKGGSRVGLSLYHLSNGSLHDYNPGSESLVIFWSLGR